MGNLSAIIPQESETVKAIYAYHKARGDAEEQRGYLGASIIGHECDRYLWFMFRQCVRENFDGRLYRLFETGRLEEARFIAELRGIGCEVHEHDPDDDTKQIAVEAFNGHFSGHLDAIALGVPEAPKTWHVCEFKTHNDKSFEKLRSVGVKEAKPQHYAQMQVYMGLAKLTRALYLARDKDTDELYSERVEFNSAEFKALMARAERIIFAMSPPVRMAQRSDDYRCKFCAAHALCWGMGSVAVPLAVKTCRTCCHATPEREGGWSCNRKDPSDGLLGEGVIHQDEQQKACGNHLLIPGLILFADPVDAGDTWIEFQNQSDGARWRHGVDKGEWSTEELMRTPGPMVGNPAIEAAKKGLGASVASVDIPKWTTPDSLVEQYPPEDSRRVWDGSDTGIESALLQTGIEPDAQPERLFKDERHRCFEFKTKDGDFLLVQYEGTGIAAIWKGVA